MKRWGWLRGIITVVVMSCGGTNTGNPALPEGTVIASSPLSRDQFPEFSARDKSFAASNRRFAFSLFSELSGRPDNLIVSPYSVQMALAMVYAGARGSTETEMADALGFELPQDQLHAAFNAVDLALDRRRNEVASDGVGDKARGDGFDLRLVNQLWGQQGFEVRSEYLDVLALNYGTDVFLLDFSKPESARSSINNWVADQTGNKITELLPTGSINKHTPLVLTNAIYFKASWFNKFDTSKTRAAEFMTPDGARSIPMMRQELRTRYFADDAYEAVELPYVSPDVRMLLMLPRTTDVATLTSNMSSERYDAIVAGLSDYKVTIELPRWKFSSAREVKPALQAFGMSRAFDSDQADLSGIHEGGRLYIENVYHSAVISVDEEGTEAAAATAAVNELISNPPSVTVSYDRPFLFVLRDEPTGELLFLGTVVRP